MPRVVLLSAFLLSSWAVAQPSADDLRGAHGGAALSARTARYEVAGTVRRHDGSTAPFRLKVRGGDSRLEIGSGSTLRRGGLTQSRDGASASRLRNGRPGSSEIWLMPFRAVLGLGTDSAPAGRVGERRRFAGRRERRRLIGRPARGFAVELDFDERSGLLARAGILPEDGGPGFEILYSDYRKVQGVMTPFVVERRYGGRTVETFTLDSIDFSPAFPDSDLEPVPAKEAGR